MPKESHPPKKLLTFEHYPKEGRGVQPESKRWEVGFFGPFFTFQGVESHAWTSLKLMVLLFHGAGAEFQIKAALSLQYGLRWMIEEKSM